MNKLWAPWRQTYVSQKPERGCFLCRAKRAKKDRQNFIIARSRHSFAILNIYPYNNGHVLVAPSRHVKSLALLQDEELLDLMRLNNEVIRKIEKKMKPHGLNLGINLGRVAGAGLPGHVHIHIVPRWLGDTNFMPINCSTKIISESLKSVYNNLKS